MTQQLSKISLGSGDVERPVEENDVPEATDIGGEDVSDGENLPDESGDNEMVVEGTAFDDDDYADSEGDPAELFTGMFGMPPYNFPGM